MRTVQVIQHGRMMSKAEGIDEETNKVGIPKTLKVLAV